MATYGNGLVCGASEERQLLRSKGCCLAVLGVCLRFDRLLDVWDLNIILVKEMDEVQHLHRVALLFPCRWRTSCIIVWRRQRVPLERAALRKTTRNTTHDALSASFMPSTDGCDSHQHLALSTPSSFCHGGLCHVTTEKAGSKLVMWSRGPHSVTHIHVTHRVASERHCRPCHHPKPLVPRGDKLKSSWAERAESPTGSKHKANAGWEPH